MAINLEWTASGRGVKTALYRPANFSITVKSAKVGGTKTPTYEVWQGGQKVKNDDYDTLLTCQTQATYWIDSFASPALWDAEWLRGKITTYLHGFPFCLMETDGFIRLGEYCNSPARVIRTHISLDTHVHWLKTEWQRLGQIEARALNALTFAKSEAEKELALQILGRGVE